MTCVWVGMDGDEIVCGHVPRLRKIENIRRDPRVALSMEGAGIGEHGLKDYLVLYGTARVTEGGAPELLQKLAYTYLGPDVDFPTMPNPPPGYISHITVERIAGAGPWAQHADERS